jgi:serine/threonine protein kinase
MVPPGINRGIDVKALCEILPRAPVEALDLIRQLIQFNPKDRVSAATALTHPYIAAFYTGAEPVLGEGQSVYLSVDDNVKLRPDEYRTVLQSELDRKRKDIDAKFHALLRDIHIST